MNHKTCLQCGKSKPLEMFTTRRECDDRHDNTCKACRLKKARVLRKEKEKDKQWLKQFAPV